MSALDLIEARLTFGAEHLARLSLYLNALRLDALAFAAEHDLEEGPS